MTRLFLDSATSDLWKYGRDIPDEVQPHMVRLSWLLETEEGATIRDASHLIRLPLGLQMEEEAAHFTGIHQRFLEARGLRMFDVLGEFAEALGEADLVVAHALTGNKQVLDRSFRYVGMPMREWPPGVDAMIKATNIVQIPAMKPGGGFRWPTFDQCCERFIGNRLGLSVDPVSDGMIRVHSVRVFYQNIVRYGFAQPAQENSI